MFYYHAKTKCLYDLLYDKHPSGLPVLVWKADCLLAIAIELEKVLDDYMDK